MASRRERFSGLKNKLEKNRSMIVYTLVLLALMGAAVGWGLLPERVTMAPGAEEAIYRPKEQLILMNLALSLGFSGLFWKWPREAAYLFGAAFGVVMTFGLLYLNLGV